MIFEMNEKEWHKQLFNDKNKPNRNKLRTYQLYKNSLGTCNYAENVRCRNKRSVSSNFRNGLLPLQTEKGRYTTPVTQLDFRTCKYVCR